jgi:hypothetical protein
MIALLRQIAVGELMEDSGSGLPIASVASLVGFGAVAMPAFALVRDRALSIGDAPLVRLAILHRVAGIGAGRLGSKES